MLQFELKLESVEVSSVPNFIEAATSALRRLLCSTTIGADNYWNMFLPSTLSGYSPFARTGLAYRSFCDREPPQLPESAIGGQCPTIYAVTVEYRIYNKNTQEYELTDTFTVNVNGKIKGLRPRTSNGQLTTYLVHGSPTNPDAGVESLVVSSDASATDHRGTRIVSIVRLDGQPDNCGNQPPPLVRPDTPGPPPSGDINITYNNDEGDPITVNGFVAFGFAYIDADLNLNVPFTLELNPEFNIPVNGTINLNGGDINFNFGNGNTGSTGGGCKDAVKNWDTDDEPSDSDDDSIDIDPVDPDDTTVETVKVIKGVITYVQGISNKVSTVFQENTQDLLVPRCGNVQFLIQVGTTLAWSTDYPVRCNRGLIVCDWPGGAVDVRVTPYPGYSISLQRVYYPIPKLDT